MKAPIPVKLDRERRVAWSNAALYRLGQIQLQPITNYTFFVQMIWACLVPEDAKAFPTPEHLAEYMPVERAAEFAEVVTKLTPKKKQEPDAKNADGSTQSDSPASSLD